MEDVIKKIISIEHKAQQIIDKAEKEKEDKQSDLVERLAVLKQDVEKDAKRKIKEIRKQEVEEAKVEAQLITERCSSQLLAMEEKYEENKDNWKDELVEAVLKR